MIENFNFGRVVIIGDLLLDCYVTGAVNRISPEAPVPVLLRKQSHAVPGGAANVAMNAAALGCDVCLVGLVGDDVSAATLRKELATVSNLDISGLVTDSNWTTITKTRVLSGRQQIVRIDEEYVAPLSDEIKNKLIKTAHRLIEHADVVVCSDYAKGVLTDDVLEGILTFAKARDIPVIVDPKRKDFSAYSGAWLVTPNRGELALTVGVPLKSDAEIELAAREASRQFGGHVLVTRSEEGMTLFQTDGKVTHSVVRKSEVYDVSGAGDTVVATIASVISAGYDLETAIVIATSAASIVVGKLGTATVSIEELSAALKAESIIQSESEEDKRVVSMSQACALVNEWRHHGARVVFTNGCFDLLHPGHVALLRQAARQGDKLIVGLNSDASVKRLKGEERPLQDEGARAAVMSALRDVDLVVLFEEDTPLEIIKELRPDIIVKGSDYTEDQVVGGDYVKSYGGAVVLVDVLQGRSTTSIVKKMKSPPVRS
ncbi:D-glycero-beta-D-manno-heptose-7-phosphate kinase [Swingsia samuiensis]|uniref:Bifunctional protein HldE n=1 Tax=Swingsia samuiensis TaxID=1293412 RepID=A0A4Y6UFP1_9PROT|nr:D-glycero-beta-D-manno-heptose-7-phosphate kinase [Swingsia samuiensis]QDH16382.1 D-glycero-beta-D-manno-heptose-7-phosphate kinase [Swingsia samuiensis]